jgi:1-phosphofructokinase family hexose kinase
MFLSVTSSPPVDKILFIPEWTPGIPQHATLLVTSVGGKGLDASVALRHLGQPTTGLFMAAGETGKELENLVSAYGILPEIIWTEGESRTAHIIAEALSQQHTHIFTGGLSINAAHKKALLERFQALLPGADWVLTGGTVPPGQEATIYYTLADLCRQAGKPILIDSLREPMLQALPAGPTIVKMNRAEFAWTFKTETSSLEALIEQAEQVYKDHRLNALVVTCGADGILAFTPNGFIHAVPPLQVVVNAAGAGDSASGALAWRLYEGDSWVEAVHWAAAVSAACVLCEGTADLRFEDVRRIYPDVALVCSPDK